MLLRLKKYVLHSQIRQLFFTENKSQKILLPPLMTKIVPRESLFKIFWSYLYIKRTIDHEFNNETIMQGIKQAILVISEALSKQNYEALDGIVSPKAIKVLKHRVNHLTPSQQELLSINLDFFGFFTRSLTSKRIKGSKDVLVEIAVHGMTMIGIPVERESYIYICYVFQRKYKNGMGGPWIVKLS
ncbi:hypothetical protein E2986_05984 [Frieseomelitta varia]|uniref:Uncharacterized protein n=1 Tax=Frieseomelitta varia TaxID=561572 RepID=A0A833RXH3_9HYME|nr:hypothetical protein E2986_05984 [Frieseomelitta varia]